MANASSLTPDQKKKLMVNYLPQSVDVSDLRAMFLQFGPIANVHIVKNKETSQSKGYGFVTYENEESSQNAIDVLNGKQIGEKRLRVAYSTPLDSDGKFKPSSSGDDINVYIANIPKSWDQEELTRHFTEFGPVKHSKILTDATGSSRGAGFVRYETSKMAAAAILEMDGKCPDGGSLPLIVKIADGKKKSSSVPGLVLNNGAHSLTLNHNASSNSFSHASPDYRFNPYGKPPSASAPANAYTHPGAYPPIASTYSPAPAASPHQNMHPSTHPAMHTAAVPSSYMPQGQPMMPSYQQAPPHQHMIPQQPVTPAPPVVATSNKSMNYCLYVGNLPETTCKSCLLYQLFAPYGAVANVKPMSNVKQDSNNDHWFAFVNMKMYQDAAQAIEALNGSTLNGRTLKVDFKTDKRKS